jgi:hypothetical protein
MKELSDPAKHRDAFQAIINTPEYKEAARKVKAERAERMEGRVYAFMMFHQNKGICRVTRWYYTVLNGLVCEISKGNKISPTGDDLAEIEFTGHLIGKYDPKKNYEQTCGELTYSEMKKAFKLKPPKPLFNIQPQ